VSHAVRVSEVLAEDRTTVIAAASERANSTIGGGCGIVTEWHQRCFRLTQLRR